MKFENGQIHLEVPIFTHWCTEIYLNGQSDYENFSPDTIWEVHNSLLSQHFDLRELDEIQF